MKPADWSVGQLYLEIKLMVKVLTSKDNRESFRRYGYRTAAAVLLLIFCIVLSSCGGAGKRFRIEAEESVMALDPNMGDWQGGWKLSDGSGSGPLAAQVIALGKGEYKANLLEAFDTEKKTKPMGVLEGRLEDGAVSLEGKARHGEIDFDVKARIEGGKFTGTFAGGNADRKFTLNRVFRVSPTMGAKPPKGAVVLFDGKDFEEWKRATVKEGESDAVSWELVDDAMRVTKGGGSIITRKKFADIKLLHIEFRSPFMPNARGQGRGNSGVYLQGRYEVQMLDSYGLKGESNECGGIYGVKAPKVNMCAPPGQWQTYDITFRAATAESKPTLTVRHNDILIQDKTEVGKTTASGLGGKATEPAGIYLQDHGNAVEYRNIWLIEQ